MLLGEGARPGVRQKTREKSYRRIVGFDQPWMLKAHLDDREPIAKMKMAG